MTVQEAYKRTQMQLYEVYDNREATNIADQVMAFVTGYSRTDRLVRGHEPLTHAQANKLTLYTLQLLQHVPLQYVLQEAWFAAMPFFVNESVLIPRPETEELVEWVAQEARSVQTQATTDATVSKSTTIIDIGTGSGCIPIALKKKLPTATVHALDVSPGALAVARRNASTLEAAITFHETDILQQMKWQYLPVFDIIVSNPPYIKESEKADMHENVLGHEPHLALFVSDADALLFYRTIAQFAQQHLRPGGMLFFEINEALGKETTDLLISQGFINVELRKDMQGKDRMIKAILPA